MTDRCPIRLPKQWPEHVKTGILHAISLASVALTIARGRAISRELGRGLWGAAGDLPAESAPAETAADPDQLRDPHRYEVAPCGVQIPFKEQDPHGP